MELIPFEPIRDMKEFIGTYEELLKNPKTDDYVRIVLKDEDYIPDIKHLLENNYTNIMEIVYDNAYTSENKLVDKADMVENQSPVELFKTFYELQNNRALDSEQLKLVEQIFEQLEGIA